MRAKNIFIGPIGLRSAWRLLIFLAIVIALQAGFQGIVLLILKARGMVAPEGLYSIVFLVADGITLLAVVVASWIMAKWEHRKLSDYGLPGKNALGWKFWEGAAFGYVGVSLLLLVIYLAGGYSPGSLALHGVALMRSALLWLLASLAIGFAEEYFFRGYPQFILAQGMGFWPAAFCISFLFGALHYFLKSYERWPDWASTGLIALLLCLTLRRTGDLRFAIGFPRGVRFWRNLRLLRTERRTPRARPLIDSYVSWRRLADRRKARPGGEPARLSRDCRDVSGVSFFVPRSSGNRKAVFAGVSFVR